MVQDAIHCAINRHQSKVADWFLDKAKGNTFPIYSSFDVRESGYKLAPVDANIYPAGFNNICQVDRDSSVQLVKDYIDTHYQKDIKNVSLIAEEHTNNAYYWQNIYSLYQMLTKAGFDVNISLPKNFEEKIEVVSSGGQTLNILPSHIKEGKVIIASETPDLIICNNDFSVLYEHWKQEIKTPINPPFELGWFQRKKSDFFKIYNELALGFAETIEMDPFLFSIKTDTFSNFDITDEESRKELAGAVDEFLSQLQKAYTKQGVEEKPFVFVKNNSGTYGLGVTKVSSGADVLSWNYKSRKKMKAAKGGGGFSEVIIQEGIPTRYQSDGVTAEPTIYMIGQELAGGFLRAHSKKGAQESLNSPGAVYKKLCVSDLKTNCEQCPEENVLGWVSKIGVLAIGKEARENKVQYVSASFIE